MLLGSLGGTRRNGSVSLGPYLEVPWSLRGKEEELRTILAITMLSRRSTHPLPLGAESTSPPPPIPSAAPPPPAHSIMGAGEVPGPPDVLGFSAPSGNSVTLRKSAPSL